MSRKILPAIALCALLARPAGLSAQEVSADTLHVKQIDGEDVRDLIGHVVLTQEKTRVTCEHALQYIARGVFYLTGNVVVSDDSMTLRAPRGTYNRPERRAEGFDGVRLDEGATRLTADYGEYFAEERRAYFRTHVVVVDSTSIVSADTLLYWRITRRSRALGRVVVESPPDRLTISGGRLDNDAARLYSRMTVSPLLVQIDSAADGRFDTLRVRGRVLESFRDSTRRLIARDSVEVLRSDLAATSRYACFFTAGDSILLRQAPVIWYRETQVTGDSINVYMLRRKLERLLVMGSAFAASRSDSLHPERVDQIEGDRLRMLFGAGGLRRTDVEGRALSVYHLYDDTLANGLNKTSGDRIVMLFAEGKAEAITVYGGVEGEYFPENMVRGRESEYALPGFTWRLRPVRH
ncbi:MAG TPA: OstA-like protein [Bacteroidota bacterium]|nr:OstA-like protein [Bacteroidota bacterium]